MALMRRCSGRSSVRVNPHFLPPLIRSAVSAKMKGKKLLTSKQKIASGGIFAIFGSTGVLLSVVATFSGIDNPVIFVLLFLGGVIAGLGATLAVAGLSARKRMI